jgi:membrane-bound serine protease (ClpP class)
MTSEKRHGLAVTLVLSMLLLCPSFEVTGQPAAASIRVVQVAGVINPVVADFITAELASVNAGEAEAFLLELDTPGGLDTAMRAIIQSILGSEAPVIVYVYPSGARAASAGALITLAADFAAMAPGTNIGAAHPVTIGPGPGRDGDKESPMMAKVVEDSAAYARSIAQQRGRNVEWAERIVRESISTPATEAHELGVIDIVAADENSLLAALDGRTYQRGGEEKILKTEGAVLNRAEMGWRQKILNAVSHPNVAYLLMMLGILGIFFEISQPGVILPGAIGAIALLLAFFGLQTLPVNYVGFLLILLGIILFILEVFVTSYGMLSIGGLVALTMGSLMLIDTSVPYLQISRVVIFATVAVCGGFVATVLFFVVRTQRTHFVSGVEGMVGELGQAVTDIHQQGKVFVHGEYWDAFSTDPIAFGETVEVVRIAENMRMEVKKVESASR